MKFIQVGDKGIYKVDLERSAIAQTISRHKTLENYFNYKVDLFLNGFHEIEELEKVNDCEYILKTICVKECYFFDTFGKFLTIEEKERINEQIKQINE